MIFACIDSQCHATAAAPELQILNINRTRLLVMRKTARDPDDLSAPMISMWFSTCWTAAVITGPLAVLTETIKAWSPVISPIFHSSAVCKDLCDSFQMLV